MLISDRGARHDIARGFLQAAGHGNVLVTSCHRGEGKTTIAFNIAHAVAEDADRSVLLVDANVEAPRLHTLFAISESPGFLDVLDGKEATESSSVDQLFDVMPVGEGHAGSGGLVKARRAARLKEFLDARRQHGDLVILDGSSVFGVADPTPIARVFDAVVLVVESEQTRWEVVQTARDRLRESGAKILGVVLNKRRYHIPRSLYV